MCPPTIWGRGSNHGTPWTTTDKIGIFILLVVLMCTSYYFRDEDKSITKTDEISFEDEIRKNITELYKLLQSNKVKN